MRKISVTSLTLILLVVILTSCGGNAPTAEAALYKEDTNVDVCRCLTESGNSEWLN